MNDTFPSKEILLIRTAKEVNFAGCSTSAKRSDDHQIQIVGVPNSWFCMFATFSPSNGWKVTWCKTRIALPVNDDYIAVEEEVENVGDKGGVDINTGEEFEESEGENFEEGNANGSDADGSVTIKESKNPSSTRTPIKSCWIHPFIKDEIAQTPNISNQQGSICLRNMSRRSL